jgi:MFS family permease
MRFLLGIAEAGFFPGVIFYLTLWYPSRLRATRTAWFVAAIAVSGVIGNPISGWIMDMFSGAGGMAVAIPVRRHSFDYCGLLCYLLPEQQY